MSLYNYRYATGRSSELCIAKLFKGKTVAKQDFRTLINDYSALETTEFQKEGFETETKVYYSLEYGERTESYRNGQIYTRTYNSMPAILSPTSQPITLWEPTVVANLHKFSTIFGMVTCYMQC